ncbi:MAG: H(+)-transporting V1 sector ATPase subunit D [Watsoniomyces obsoletus]|nr:MAG: H(+)-transporting V1 sector ATPase subunit D [Watsoniomyces obsoletus]
MAPGSLDIDEEARKPADEMAETNGTTQQNIDCEAGQSDIHDGSMSIHPASNGHLLQPCQENGALTPDSINPSSEDPEKVFTQPQPTNHEPSGNKVDKMYKFSVYMTASRFYIIGGDLTDDRFRVLKVDRMGEAGELTVAEDGAVYSKQEMNQLLNTIDDGNRSTGGLQLKCITWGLLGFIRFTGPYYMLLITKRSQVAMVGGHYIYQVDGTELVSLAKAPSSRFRQDRHPEESRFLGIFNNLDLSKSFYFSYSYDITRTLQQNMIRARQRLQGLSLGPPEKEFNDMFVWNHHLLAPVIGTLKRTHDWCLPIVHGYVDQATLSIFGREVYITIIARRSRFFAGARFLKRGANDLGYVANDVETEQIVSDLQTTSFHAPGPKLFGNCNHTSYVQHRGSIPVFWTQDNTGVTPKPPIELNLVDPFYAAAALHFDNLFERYGAPVYVLNLVKSRERTPRESKLLNEFTDAIAYLNQFLPDEKKILYKAWDMSRASKSRDQDVIGTLESIAEEVVRSTSIFRNGDEDKVESLLQQGTARTNCIDCLDRTNAAQFVIGKRALGHQLHALGVISDTTVDYDTDAVNLFTHMYHEHGDNLAIQYGGSHLVNTMETYRKMNKWTSQSRDMVESFKRYYHNSFLDSQRQEAYNLFLGNYIFTQGQPMLWDLPTDYYLHHTNPRMWSGHQRRSYINWFTPSNLQDWKMPALTEHHHHHHHHHPLGNSSEEEEDANNPIDDFWLEYYRPLAVSSFQKIFSYRINSTLKYIPYKTDQEDHHHIDPSPFRVRNALLRQSPRRRRTRRSVTASDPYGYKSDDNSSQTSHSVVSEKLPPPHPSQQWPVFLSPTDEKKFDKELFHQQRKKDSPKKSNPLALPHPSTTTERAQRTLDQFITDSLNPTVTQHEAEEYQRYLDHPQTLTPVVSTDIPPGQALEFTEYLQLNNTDIRCAEVDLVEFTEYLNVVENPLEVTEADKPKKRYKAYRQWLKGKSLFRQQQRAVVEQNQGENEMK